MLNLFSRKSKSQIPTNSAEDFLTQAVHLKYNLYMLGEAIIFASVVGRCKDYDEAVTITASIMKKLNEENGKINGK